MGEQRVGRLDLQDWYFDSDMIILPARSIRDLVDTTLFDPKTQRLNSDYLLKALLGGMNRTIDARN